MKQNPIAIMTPDPTPDPVIPATLGLCIDVIISEQSWTENTADPAALCRRATKTGFELACTDGLDLPGGVSEISIMLTSDQYVQELNRDYRGIDKPTNVLSFANLDTASLDTASFDTGDAVPLPDGAALLLGDIIVAYETVDREASAEGKALEDHLTHMIVHGMLHLLGYDHQTTSDANHMEALEIKILERLGIADPYAGGGVDPNAKDRVQ